MNQKQQVKFVPKHKSPFFSVLKTRVDEYFNQQQKSKYANTTMVVKTAVLLSGYILPFVALLYFTPSLGISLLLWFVMGLSLAGIGMSVMHDANHGAYSANKTVNFLMGHTLNLVGGSVFNWKLQHNILHHTYTNITYIDEDIEDRLVLKFSPHTKVKWFHKFQWIYAMFFYGLLTFYWVLAKDFIQFAQFTKSGVNSGSKSENNSILIRIIFIKLFYFLAVIVMPIMVFNIPVLQILSGFLLMHFVAGIVLTTVFQLAHTLEQTAHPMPVNGIIDNDWAIHQLNTTVNFSRNSKILSWYIGGLNFQVEHHLFPKISHVHYPAISHIVKQTAEEFGIPYLENPSLWSALQSHFNYMREIGTLPDPNTAIN
ncbi:MAG: acyl-CoA desaturase [Bacteroidia bacterium]|nr:acyl-CoA desaturase [Bacteroidia bacterium]